MKKEYIDFACALHGYLIRTKEIHWNTNSDAEHIHADDFHNDLEECEDKIMECCMGMDGNHFPIGKLLPMLPNSTSFLPMLKELEKDTLKILKNCKSEECGGLVHLLNELLECINKYKYRVTQK